MCVTNKRAYERAVTCNLRFGRFEAAQDAIDTLRGLPDGQGSADACQALKDALVELFQQARLLCSPSMAALLMSCLARNRFVCGTVDA